jgi:predicted metal-dependent peptidase
MEADLLLTKAKSKLSSTHPYFGMLANKLKHEQSEKISFYASDGKRFLYNKEFIETCTIVELQFILTNCVMHHILAHTQRKLNRKGYLWQLATDFAINNILHKNKLKIPKGANHNRDFRNMYAEEIYEYLKDKYELGNESAFDDIKALEAKFENTQDVNTSYLNKIKQIDNEKIEDDWEYAATLAKEVANKKSLMPLGLERLAKKVKAKDIDWKFELYNAINKHMRNNYAFMPPNKKHLYRGVALPSLASDTLSLIVAIDTSGSIREDVLGGFIAEFKTIMTNFPTISIELLIADAKVHSHHSFIGGDNMDFALKGGGGTDYRPTFEFIEQNFPTATMLLYFTDGDGIFPKIPPTYEVLWALSQKKEKLPFGRGLLIF